MKTPRNFGEAAIYIRLDGESLMKVTVGNTQHPSSRAELVRLADEVIASAQWIKDHAQEDRK